MFLHPLRGPEVITGSSQREAEGALPQKTEEKKPLREAESEIEDEMLSLRPQAKGHKWPLKARKDKETEASRRKGQGYLVPGQ